MHTKAPKFIELDHLGTTYRAAGWRKVRDFIAPPRTTLRKTKKQARRWGRYKIGNLPSKGQTATRSRGSIFSPISKDDRNTRHVKHLHNTKKRPPDRKYLQNPTRPQLFRFYFPNPRGRAATKMATHQLKKQKKRKVAHILPRQLSAVDFERQSEKIATAKLN